MKTILFVLLVLCSLYLFSCKNNNTDTSTDMPNGGNQPRTDSITTTDSGNSMQERGAVALDTVKNGQAVISGATADTSSH